MVPNMGEGKPRCSMTPHGARSLTCFASAPAFRAIDVHTLLSSELLVLIATHTHARDIFRRPRAPLVEKERGKVQKSVGVRRTSMQWQKVAAAMAATAMALVIAQKLLRHRKALLCLEQQEEANRHLTARKHSILKIQSCFRGHRARLQCGSREQVPMRRLPPEGVRFRVCTSLSCFRRGAENVLACIEDLVPPSLGIVSSTECFALCGVGPNVQVECSRGSSLRRGVEAFGDAKRIVSKHFNVNDKLSSAARLHERARALHVEAEFQQCMQLVELAIGCLAALPIGSITALRLSYKLHILLATTHLRLDQPQQAKEAALAAAEVQSRLARSHACGQRKSVPLKWPREAPALLLAAEACITVAEKGLDVVTEAARAIELLDGLLERGALHMPASPNVLARLKASERRRCEAGKRLASRLLQDTSRLSPSNTISAVCTKSRSVQQQNTCRYE